ncbi:hypothetical protein EVAR_102240_1 [Eumeta japonica]|uniref:Uncharacterized protein n=1 Tax=Eumeta variegata TaxID=151549 RepID=A0A4C1WGP3_EUMVA|nr:hypothetical protein EVAR_102240_1 [Eumeta japonica]
MTPKRERPPRGACAGADAGRLNLVGRPASVLRQWRSSSGESNLLMLLLESEVATFVRRRNGFQARKLRRDDRSAQKFGVQESLTRLETAFGDEAPKQLFITGLKNSNVVVSMSVIDFVNPSFDFREPDFARPPVNNKIIDAMRRTLETDGYVTYH